MILQAAVWYEKMKKRFNAKNENKTCGKKYLSHEENFTKKNIVYVSKDKENI